MISAILSKTKITELLFALVLLFSSQVSAEELASQAEALIENLSPLASNIVRQSPHAVVIEDPYSYISGRPGKYIYQMMAKEDDEPDTKFEIHGEYSIGSDGSRRWISKIDDDFIEEWQADSKGNVHLIAQTDVESGYRVVFTPHLVLPAGALQGQHWENKSSLAVYEVSDPKIVAYEGSLLSKKVYEGLFEITTPAGSFDAILISDEYEIEIGPVNIKDRRYTFYASGVGKVAEIDGFHVSAFLFFHDRRNEVKVMMSLPQKYDE